MTRTTAILSFPGGCKVLSERTGEVLYKWEPGEHLAIDEDRLVPVPRPERLYRLQKGRLVLVVMTEAEWLRRELSKAPRLTRAQTRGMRLVKGDLRRIASRQAV